METKTQRGYLVLADISGFTSYLAKSELDHALGILRDLLEVTSTSLRSLLDLSKLEGDAVFLYASESKVRRGETLLEVVESTYVTFRRRLDAVHGRTKCSCKACGNIPSLDLKFMTHFGEYGVQTIAGTIELIGSDVNLVHRLLKNRISDTVGWRGYALFTKQALEQMGISAEGFLQNEEMYDHLGSVATYTTHLHERFEELTAARRFFLEPKDAHMSVEKDLPAPPVVVWEWLNDPAKRELWSGLTVKPLVRPKGRTMEGARNHCVHGKEVIVEDILDWRPFDYFTVRSAAPLGDIVTTMTLEANGERTRLVDRTRFEPKSPLLKPFSKLLLRMMYRVFKIEQRYSALEQRIATSTK
ncbi:MAG TPA: DUF2652 domain-containing protein [Bacteroidota bacterium]|nr:DUF2652 domain-containing protein [Bacteroidota bacterium]